MALDIKNDPMMSIEGWGDLLAQRHPNSQMTANALQQGLVSDGAAAFLQAVFQDTLSQSLASLFEKTPAPLLAPFGGVWLQDSTQCRRETSGGVSRFRW